MQGIYEIYSTVTEKCYIGSSINVEQRWRKHRSDLRLKHHHSKPLQAEYDEGNEFIYRMIETCTIEEMEEKEAFYISESDCYNTSLKTGTAMRDKAVSAKAIASRLDQSGLNASNIKASKELYLRVFRDLINKKTPHKIEAAIGGELSNTTITRIRAGKTHHWLKEEDPEGYELMLRWGEAEEGRVSRGKLYQIKHKKGEEFEGNVQEICEKLGITEDMCKKLLKKTLVFVKGWRPI